MRIGVLGACDNYGWSEVSVWVKSLRETGFDGPVALVVYRVPPTKLQQLVDKCKEYNVYLVQADANWNNKPINHTETGAPTMVNRNRFYHFWQFLYTSPMEVLRESGFDHVTHVLHNDVKDVYFQRNPEEYPSSVSIKAKPWGVDADVFCTSEGVLYKNEPWNYKLDLGENFGPVMQHAMSDKLVYNCGVILSKLTVSAGLYLNMFLMSQGRLHGADQASFNLITQILHRSSLETHVPGHANPWVCQCTTMMAPAMIHEEPVPDVSDISNIKTASGETFTMIHQYDRFPNLKEYAEKRWREN